MAYLSLIVITTGLLYIWLYICLKRRRTSRRLSIRGTFTQTMYFGSPVQSAPLSLFTSESLESGYGQSHSIAHESIYGLLGAYDQVDELLEAMAICGCYEKDGGSNV